MTRPLLLGLLLLAGCASGPIEGEAASGIAWITSERDPALAFRAANEALDALSAREILGRGLERAHADRSSEAAFESAAAPDPSVGGHPWDRDDFRVVATYRVGPAALRDRTATLAVDRRFWFSLATRPHELYTELAVVLLPAPAGRPGVLVNYHVSYAFPRDEKDRTLGIRLWRALFTELKRATRAALDEVGKIGEPLPSWGRERK